jgi:hypothetical protein
MDRCVVTVWKNATPVGTVTIHQGGVFNTGYIPPVVVAEVVVAYFRDDVAFGDCEFEGDAYDWDESDALRLLAPPDPSRN